MPWIAFVDEELSTELKKLSSGNEEEPIFPEHSFIATCLRAGLTMKDLKSMTYVDVMKILLSFISPKSKEEENGYRKATQADWDKLM